MVGGLLMNSGIGVYSFNPQNKKSLQSAKSGIAKVIEYRSKIKNADESLFGSFIDTSNTVLNSANSKGYVDGDDLKNILKSWRPLKFDIIKKLKKLKQKQKLLQAKFSDDLNSLFSKMLIVIVINTILITVISAMISSGIIKSLDTLEESMEALAKGEESKKIELENQDETANIAKYFNCYMDNITKGLEQDKLVITEVKIVLDKINSGLLNTNVKGHANSKEVEELVQALNGMIETTSKNLGILSEALVSFGNSAFDHKVPRIEGLSGLMASMFMGIKGTGNTVSEIIALIDNSNKKLIFGSKDLTQSAKNLSDSSNTQAAALEQTAASVEEVTETIKHTTQNTVQMSTYATEVTNSVTKGKELARQTSESMDHIQTEVNSISEAITIIDQIAFQTNILSLNAAVEAATAGESGKGFAVVAGEVRNLASRSSEAANDIKTLVESAKDKAGHGKSISSAMIEGYTSLNDNIQNTIDLISLVTRASKEQENAMIQINEAISSLDQSIQQNASEAQEISDMAVVNEKLAQNLQVAIDRTTFDKTAKKRVCDVNMIFDISKLKLKHIGFKDNAFAKSKDGAKFRVTDHHSCDLGRWIDANENNPEFAGENWEELKLAHKNVHSMTQDVADLHAGGYENGHLFAAAQGVEDNIAKVFDKLNDIRETQCDYKFKKIR
jgi:methyl-accepting chemotaxis protein